MVDNGSTDGSVQYLTKKFPQVRVLALDKNYGFATGNNKGAKLAKGELLVFLNNDTVVDKNWLYELVKVIESNKKIAICGSRVLSHEGKTQYAGSYLHSLGGKMDYPFHEDKPDRDYYLVGSILGASFAIRREVFEKLGGFDDDFFLYGEECDLCLRAWIFGYTVAYAVNSIVYHYGGGSIDKFQFYISKFSKSKFKSIVYGRLLSQVRVYYENRNSLVILIKNLQTRNLLKSLPFYYLYLFFQLLLLLYIKSDMIKLIIKAGIWPLKNLKIVWRKRLAIQRKRKVSDDWLLKNELLLSVGKTLKLAIHYL